MGSREQLPITNLPTHIPLTLGVLVVVDSHGVTVELSCVMNRSAASLTGPDGRQPYVLKKDFVEQVPLLLRNPQRALEGQVR
jgi:hypothetical protein